jgi:hypothetical protein
MSACLGPAYSRSDIQQHSETVTAGGVPHPAWTAVDIMLHV